ncbi:MAG: heavy metal sensor histidine kinase [Burkholderiales bacterium]|nr:heavy metal sensor histidine kinase [Burkholderiales bacterium]
MATRAPSLGRRLSIWLAVQGLLVALLISALVYAINAWRLRERQFDELQRKRDVVRHALAETAVSGDLAELKHRFDDFLAGHDDMDLRVAAPGGLIVYASSRRGQGAAAARIEKARWTDHWPAREGSRVDVELSLDIGPDELFLRRLGIALFLASLAGAALVSVTGLLIVRRGLRPVRALSAQVESMALDHPHLRLDGSAQPLELLPLVERFNVLLARVERAYAQLEAFNADVAHELRTPLTTLIGASELALRRARPADELREVIGANLEDLHRLAGIVNDMLFLSRADRGEAARRTAVESLAGALADILDFHEAALHERNLTVRVEGDARGQCDIALLRRALSNLLSNANRYAAPGSVVKVVIASTGKRVRLCVVNRGEPIAPEHLPRLFDRFFRVERSRRQPGTHYGLGLAIVAAIARMHGGAPFATSEDGLTTIGIEIDAG